MVFNTSKHRRAPMAPFKKCVSGGTKIKCPDQKVASILERKGWNIKLALLPVFVFH